MVQTINESEFLRIKLARVLRRPPYGIGWDFDRQRRSKNVQREDCMKV